MAAGDVPTVFIAVGDPVGGGFADRLARPGGNATGFMAYEWSISDPAQSNFSNQDFAPQKK
jgi:putative ABC transport system substrate-binding protein